MGIPVMTVVVYRLSRIVALVHLKMACQIESRLCMALVAARCAIWTSLILWCDVGSDVAEVQVLA